MVPVIPEMISSGSAYYPGRIIEVTDISAGMFNCGLGVGQVLGPIFGSYITRATDFRTCSDLVGLILLVYSLLYFLVGDGIPLLSTSCKDPIKKELDVFRLSPSRNVGMRGRLLSNLSHDDSHDLDTMKLIYNTPLMNKQNRNNLE
jgi:MFS family permease